MSSVKKYKILHIANFKTENNAAMFYNTDAKIQHGLIELGHYVQAFDYKFMVRKSNIFNTTSLSHKKTHQQLIDICENLRPDIILLGHVNIPSNVIQTLKSISNPIVAAWFVDTINEEHRIEHFKEMHKVIDYLFVTTGGEYLKTLSALCKNTVCTFTPNLTLRAIEHVRTDWQTYEHDYIFCATNAKSQMREEFTTHLTEGTRELRAKLAACMDNPPLFGEFFLSSLRSSLMGINYSKYNDIYLYSSDRIAQLMGSGCLTLIPEIPGARLIYPEDSVIYCRTTDDFVSQLKYYAAHPELAIDIAKKGYQLAHSLFESSNVMRLWLDLLETGNFDAPWAEETYLNGEKQ